MKSGTSLEFNPDNDRNKSVCSDIRVFGIRILSHLRRIGLASSFEFGFYSGFTFSVSPWTAAISTTSPFSIGVSLTAFQYSPSTKILPPRESINLKLQEIIDRQTEPWGVKVTAVEVKDVALPDTMKRAMAKQAEAERERRAKVVNAEGEFQAAEKMVQAAAMMSKEPIALQLRFLQTMREISSEHNTTTFLPVPIDLFTPFINKGEPPKP